MVSTDVLTTTNVSEQRDDGGYLRFTDGDVMTVRVAMKMNTSGQCQPGRSIEMASMDVLTDSNVSKRRDDGGHLRSTDGDVTTVHDTMVSSQTSSHTTSIIRLKI